MYMQAACLPASGLQARLGSSTLGKRRGEAREATAYRCGKIEAMHDIEVHNIHDLRNWARVERKCISLDVQRRVRSPITRLNTYSRPTFATER